jgi:phage terminase small subunit
MTNDLIEVDEAVPVRQGMTAKQSAFIDAYVANGGQLKAAAVEAGYAEKSAHVEANRLMKNPLICQEIHKECMMQLARKAPVALQTVTGLMQSAKSEFVKLQAAQDWLDRAGFKPIDRKQIQMQGDLQVNIDLS